MPAGALLAIARAEWRRGARSLVAIGVLAGLVGGLLIGGAALARRTSSAPDRLLAAVAPGDVHLQIFGPGVSDAVAALPQVERSVTGGIAVGRLEGPAVVYNGLFVPGEPSPDLLRPVVIEGRAADPTAGHEVVVVQDAAEALGMSPGSEITLHLLTPEEVAQFDVGFGEPDGPRLELTVTGLVRVPPGVLSSTPVIGTPALADEVGAAVAGSDMFLRLRPGERAAFEAALAEIAAGVEMPPGAEEFPPVLADDPAAGTAEAVRSGRVLVVGMVVALSVGLAAAFVVLWQAVTRHHAGSAAAQRIEAALGLTARERAVARLLPAVVSLVVATAVAVATSVALARVGPPGAVARLEPEPGWRLDVPAVLVGATALVLLLAVVVLSTALRVGRSRPAGARPVRAGIWGLAPRRRGWPLAGVAFALSSGDRRGRVPVRASLAGAVLGLAGVVASMTFGASLDRLVTTPERYGWSADLVVVDATDDIVAELRADDRVGSVTDLGSASVTLDGVGLQAYAPDPGAEEPMWELVAGRMPAGSGEVVVGTRAATDLGLAVGDTVPAGPEGAVDVEVVGIGIGPTLGGEPFGRALLLHPDGMSELSEVQLFREAMVWAAPGADAGALTADLAARYEVGPRELPRTVRDLADLGTLPEWLGGFLALLGVAALGHALVVTTRRRAGDLAILHALGSTPREVGLSIVAMAASTAVVGVALGAPLGWLVARLAWGEVARGAGVAGDVLVPAQVAAAVVVAVAVAVVVALPSARRAARRAPAGALRVE